MATKRAATTTRAQARSKPSKAPAGKAAATPKRGSGAGKAVPMRPPAPTKSASKRTIVRPAAATKAGTKAVAKTYAANNKTNATAAPVAAYLAAIADPTRRADCAALVAIMEAATGCPAAMWGAGIVGFDSYHYVYESGREGDMCVVGFSSRKGDISVYLTADFPGRDALLAKLGRHKMAKACLYLRTLADVDRAVLEKLVAGAVAERRRRHT